LFLRVAGKGIFLAPASTFFFRELGFFIRIY
jgi:hypothetical protein